jgi:hypothetical protein
VGGDFNCYANSLTSLEGAPQEVGGDFNCLGNDLTSLAGAPQEVGGDFRCHRNQLISLEGAPQVVGGDFNCENNQLTSLKGAPQEVIGNFNCYNNKLTSLEGVPQKIGGSFIFNGLKISWDPVGWLEGFKKYPDLFALLIDDPDILEPHLRNDPKLLINVYTKLSPQTRQELDKRLDTSGEEIRGIRNLGELGFL